MKRFLLPLLLFAALPLAAADITRDAVLTSMNAYRAERGLPPLHFEARLQKAADDFAAKFPDSEIF